MYIVHIIIVVYSLSTVYTRFSLFTESECALQARFIHACDLVVEGTLAYDVKNQVDRTRRVYIPVRENHVWSG